jgi:hypothetical protein
MMIPRTSALFLSCVLGAFLGGSQGGDRYAPHWLHAAFGAAPQNFFFGWFLLFLADFAIFSDLLKIILVLGIKVLVSMEYLKKLYILYSEW